MSLNVIRNESGLAFYVVYFAIGNSEVHSDNIKTQVQKMDSLLFSAMLVRFALEEKLLIFKC